jgi:putative Ca2+/H+ antiporter (TMEM165/GDT1 family)
VNLGLAAATFAIVIPAELPDKTFISCVVLGSRHRPGPVWFGGAAALVVQAAIAASAGRLLALLPHRVVEGVVAALFLGAGAYLLLASRRDALSEAEQDEAGERVRAATAADGRRPSAARIAGTTFVVVGLAEFGDLTQVAVANLAARYGDPPAVFAGAAVAFVLMSAIAVLIGSALTRLVPLALVRRASGVVLGALGCVSAVEAIRG